MIKYSFDRKVIHKKPATHIKLQRQKRKRKERSWIITKNTDVQNNGGDDTLAVES